MSRLGDERLWGLTAEGMRGVLHRTGFCAAFEFVAERLGCGAWSEVPWVSVFTLLQAIASWGGLAEGVLHNSVASPLLGGGWDWIKRVRIADLRRGCGQRNFSGKGIGDGDGFLTGVVVWHCLLVRSALVNGRRARKKPAQGRGGHAGPDGVDCLWSIGTAWRASWHTGIGFHGQAGPAARWGCFSCQRPRLERAGDSLIFCCEMVAGSVGGWCTYRSIAPSNSDR